MARLCEIGAWVGAAASQPGVRGDLADEELRQLRQRAGGYRSFPSASSGALQISATRRARNAKVFLNSRAQAMLSFIYVKLAL